MTQQTVPCGECHLKPGEVCDICSRSLPIERPKGSNADEWQLFLVEHRDAPSFLAVQIAEAIERLTRTLLEVDASLAEAGWSSGGHTRRLIAGVTHR